MAITDLAVNTAFRAQDKVSKTFGRMDRAAGKFGRTADRAFAKASRSASGFGNITKGILSAGLVTRGIAQLSRGLGSVTSQFIAFDQATIGAASRFKDIGPDAINFEQQLGLIRDRAREAGSATEFTAAQSAEALDFLARAGFKSAEAFGSLDTMINLATASGEDFSRVADISSDLMGAFGLNVDDTSQKIKNLTRLNDVLVKAANSANVTIEDMFETMKIVGPIATSMGQGLEEVTAITAFLGGAGIKGSQGATALKNSILNLTAPSSTATKMLKAMGIEVDDGTGNMRKLNDIMGDLAPELKKMGNIKGGKILNEIFGKRAIAGAINISQGTDAIIALEKALKNADGTAQRTADRMRKSLGKRLTALGSAATEVGFKIIEAFEVRGEGAIDALTKAIRRFDPEPIIFGLGLAVDIIKNLWAVLKPFMPFMPWFIGMWVAYKTITGALAIAQLISSFVALGTALFSTGGAMAVLNAIMIANPVGAIIFGVTVLIGLLILVVKHWDAITAGFNAFMDNFLLGLKVIDRMAGQILDPIFAGINKAFEFLGIGPTEAEQPARRAPNEEQAAARQGVNVKATVGVNVTGPPGTTAEATTGAPEIDMGMLGGA